MLLKNHSIENEKYYRKTFVQFTELKKCFDLVFDLILIKERLWDCQRNG